MRVFGIQTVKGVVAHWTEEMSTYSLPRLMDVPMNRSVIETVKTLTTQVERGALSWGENRNVRFIRFMNIDLIE